MTDIKVSSHLWLQIVTNHYNPYIMMEAMPTLIGMCAIESLMLDASSTKSSLQ